MRLFDPPDLQKWTRGDWENGLPQRIEGFSNDTRTIEPGKVFVALKTERRDGHDFLETARERGASAALVSGFRSECTLPQLVVDDSLVALQSIAAAYRNQFTGPVVGVTGSCGKTTCKQLLGLLLGGPKRTLITQGNLNNFLGVPLTLTQIDLNCHTRAVVEAGISEPGEMNVLAEMIQADIAVLTSIGAAHLEGLGTLENVALEKSKLAVTGRTQRIYMDVTSAAFDSTFEDFPRLVARLAPCLESVGEYAVERDVATSSIRIRLDSGIHTFSFHGVQSSLASNVALAVLVASDLGVAASEIQERLSHWKAASMRGEWIELPEKRIYLDCYNANPLSMLDAIESFERMASAKRRKLYILGSMEELGDTASAWHRKVGARLNLEDGDHAYALGSNADDLLQGMNDNSSQRAERIDSMEELRGIVDRFDGDVFIKGSRRYRLETVVVSERGMMEKEEASC